ncbi:hypothetical protein F5X98DRAFT_383206 [Xylaria grammica]|nr:hypothetical protein F5X98DRAFT_383206 [Xylaria grammica]
MASRYPASVFRGGRCSSNGDRVEGLVYLVGRKDESLLDRSEGVAKGFYQRHFLAVDFELHPHFADCLSSEVAKLMPQPEATKESTRPEIWPPGDVLKTTTSRALTNRDTPMSNEFCTEQEQLSSPHSVQALVYVSENYSTNGVIREEYLLRMLGAVSDARFLGVSLSFVDTYITPFLDQTERTPSGPKHGTLSMLKSEPGRHCRDGGRMSEGLSDRLSKTDNGSVDLRVFQQLERLELANEIAMKHFRNMRSQSFPNIKAGVGNSAGTQLCRDHWELDKDGCIHLHITGPGGGRCVAVWVSAQKLSARS